LAQAAALLTRLHQTYLEDTSRGQCCAGEKNVFLEFFRYYWSKNACGYVTNQALSARLAKRNSETTEQTLRFLAAVLLSGHRLKVDW
jgi:hypothetical protein